MVQKTYIPEHEKEPSSHIGATLEALALTIASRKDASDESYTYRLLIEEQSLVLGKVVEEANEVAEAAAENDVDHLRYEVADVVYHLMVILERYGISLDELAAELNMRMKDEERPLGGMRLHKDYVKRGK